MRYRLRTLLLVMTAIAALLGVTIGLERFVKWVIIEVERDYWRTEPGVADGPPDKYPANLFTAEELQKLRTKDSSAGK